jgi:hypothetical protein
MTRGVKREANVDSRSSDAHARTRPSVPPMRARIELSVRSCLTSRPRPAPSATRTAISRSRRDIRDSDRLATFAQAINRTRAAVASRPRRIGFASLIISSFRPIAVAANCEFAGS